MPYSYTSLLPSLPSENKLRPWHAALLAAIVSGLVTSLAVLWASPSCQSLSIADHTSASATDASKWRIGILSMTNQETSYDHLAWGLKQQWAQERGYDMIWNFGQADLDALGMYIYKYLAVSEVIRGRPDLDWVLWVDYDTLITNPSVRLEDIIDSQLARVDRPDDIQMMIVRECRGWNAGVFLIRRSKWSLGMLDTLIECAKRRHTALGDQDCMTEEVKPNLETVEGIERIMWIPQHLINSYLRYRCPNETLYEQGHWRPGDLLMHFAGARNWASSLDEARGDPTAVSDPVGWLMRHYHQHMIDGTHQSDGTMRRR